MGPISLHTLRDNIVDVYSNTDGQVKEIVKKFIQKKLKPLKEATKEKI